MRKSPSQNTVKRLFALSGNQCAFPSCAERLIGDNGEILGEICHIEGANPGGERYNASQTDDERAAFENLILLCQKHHTVTDDTKTYTVQALRKMKSEHESKPATKSLAISDDQANKAIAASDTAPPVELKIGYSSLSINAQLHKYRLNVELTNKGAAKLSEWHVDIEMPALIFKGMRPNSPYYLASRSTTTVAFFRIKSEDRGGIFPGDTNRSNIDYSMDDELYEKRHQFFRSKVSAKAYAEGKVVGNADHHFEDLQKF